MEDQPTKHALASREDSNKHKFFTRADKEAILAKKLVASARAGQAAARDSRRRQRGAGGGTQLGGPAKEFSTKVGD